MNIYLTILTSFMFCTASLAQVLKYENVNKMGNAKVKATTYIASNNVRFDVGDAVIISNDEISDIKIPFLSRKRGNKAVAYSDVKDLSLKIYKIKVADSAGFKYPNLIVFDDKTYIQYQLQIEAAIGANQLTLISGRDTILNSNKTSMQEVTVAQPEIGAPLSVLQTDMIPMPTLDEKEMLLMSALEMKRFTKKYNSSIVLFSSGAVFTSLGLNKSNSDGKLSPFTVIGSVLILGGGIQGISARQHIGKSGAYLEAYANGVRITF